MGLFVVDTPTRRAPAAQHVQHDAKQAMTAAPRTARRQTDQLVEPLGAARTAGCLAVAKMPAQTSLVVGVADDMFGTMERIRYCLDAGLCTRQSSWGRVMFDSLLPMRLVDVRHVESGQYGSDDGNWTGKCTLLAELECIRILQRLVPVSCMQADMEPVCRILSIR